MRIWAIGARKIQPGEVTLTAGCDGVFARCGEDLRAKADA
jgi:hypothetical protein